MKTFKQSLHIWITTASLLAFLTGWGSLAHAPKPIIAPLVSTASAQTITTNTSALQLIQNLLSPRSRNHSGNNSSTILCTGGS